MGVVRQIADGLEGYARQNDGQFVLINVTNVDRDPPQGRLRIAVKFERGAQAASEFARLASEKAGVECQFSQFADLTPAFGQSVVGGSTVLPAEVSDK